MQATIFKANDIRGVYGDDLTDQAARAIGRAIAALAAKKGGGKKAALGRDGRLSSPALARAAAAGMQEGGLEVLDCGLVPTPALYYAAATRAGGNGVMITGSHNPKQYNGLKMMLNGDIARGEDLRALCLQSGGAPLAGAPAPPPQNCDIAAEYIAAAAAVNRPPRPLRVVVDAGNGATGEVAPALLAALGHEVIPLFCEIDGNFPNHHPDPAQPENTEDARRLMEERGADVAILFDGDGDRLGALLPGEPPIFADRMLMAFAQDLLQRRAGARVVFDVKCSANLPKWIAQHGGEPDMQPTGHAFIKARMKQTGAPLGGEMSGHFYLAENWRAVDDAPFAAARLLALLAANPNLFAQIPNSFASPELQVDMQGKDQHAFVERLRAAGGFADAKRIVSIDGVRAEYEYGFGLARASNTTPSLVLRFEANTPARLQEIQDVFRRALLAQDASLKLPF